MWQGSTQKAVNRVQAHSFPLRRGTWDALSTVLQDKMRLGLLIPALTGLSRDRVSKEVIK